MMSILCASSPNASFLLSSKPQLPVRSRFTWISLTSLCQSRAKVTCLAEDGSKEDAARKALEQAFGPSKRAFQRWDDEIKAREAKLDDGSGGIGRGGDGEDEGPGEGWSWDWEEAREVFLATSALIFLYLLIVAGPKGVLAIIVYLIKYVMRGFRHRSPIKGKGDVTKRSDLAERRRLRRQ